ncbi:MAG TPA: substrate-binding domain-containing protein, partial [Acidimicrobiales bacterium]|nr:substrate-binding domain-containing protein [Acidimicrobiales bacterium]
MKAPQQTSSTRPAERRKTARSYGFAAVALAGAMTLGACGSSNNSGTNTTQGSGSGSVALQETGSTLLYPLFGKWADGYHALHSNVSITSAGTGSGTGISDAEAGTVDIGASDA